MDIFASNFQSQLPSILDAIASAHFVAIDLELSGIVGQAERKSRGLGGRPSLQQRYEEWKSAAEKYQILQFGITCVEEDKDRGRYIARPYNVYVNPISDGKIGVDRIFSFQSEAASFLLRQGFQMNTPFTEGVQYLSRKEGLIARRVAASLRDKDGLPETGIKSEDTESLQFIQRVRSEVNAWKYSTSPDKPGFINIAPVRSLSAGIQENGLNKFQQYLVHQFVRAEHPGLVSIGRGGFVQIVPYHKDSDNRSQKFKTTAFDKKLIKQVGLRWLVEALVGGDLESISRLENSASKERKHEALFDRLRAKKTILVGHNLFGDLIYFYACFFGQTPDKLEDFERRIHELFPTIIDTKYLATHGLEDSIQKNSSLEELDNKLSSFHPAPVLELHHEHSKYFQGSPAHEAGYDSYLTAKVFIRLSVKLSLTSHSIDKVASKKDRNIPLIMPMHPPESQPVHHGNLSRESQQTGSSDASHGGVSLVSSDVIIAGNQPAPGTDICRRNFKRKYSDDSTTPPLTSIFAHATKFDLLGDLLIDDDDENLSLSPSPERPDRKRAKSKASSISDHASQDFIFPLLRPAMMPAFDSDSDSDFWDVYANKLRVNGTLEGICHLWKAN